MNAKVQQPRGTPVCSACRKNIAGEYYEAVGKVFHRLCFRCCSCEKPLVDGRFVPAGRSVMCAACATKDVGRVVDRRRTTSFAHSPVARQQLMANIPPLPSWLKERPTQQGEVCGRSEAAKDTFKKAFGLLTDSINPLSPRKAAGKQASPFADYYKPAPVKSESVRARPVSLTLSTACIPFEDFLTPCFPSSPVRRAVSSSPIPKDESMTDQVSLQSAQSWSSSNVPSLCQQLALRNRNLSRASRPCKEDYPASPRRAMSMRLDREFARSIHASATSTTSIDSIASPLKDSKVRDSLQQLLHNLVKRTKEVAANASTPPFLKRELLLEAKMVLLASKDVLRCSEEANMLQLRKAESVQEQAIMRLTRLLSSIDDGH